MIYPSLFKSQEKNESKIVEEKPGSYTIEDAYKGQYSYFLETSPLITDEEIEGLNAYKNRLHSLFKEIDQDDAIKSPKQNQYVPEQQQALKLISKYSYIAMLLACIPLPIIDALTIFTVEFLMLRALAKHYKMHLRPTLKMRVTLAFIATTMIIMMVSSIKAFFGIGTIAGEVTQVIVATYVCTKMGQLYNYDLHKIQKDKN